MRDGTRIAVDIYLPASYKIGDRPLPAILHVTRYNRSWRVWWPLACFLGDSVNSRTSKFVDEFSAAGYAWITMDARGTGASFGSRPCDLLPQEVDDSRAVLQWVRAQPWSNGKVGSTGISYDGIAAARMAALGDVLAVALISAPSDLYEHVIRPGGILSRMFADYFPRIVRAFEHNLPFEAKDMPLWLRALSIIPDGAAPVEGHETELLNAVVEHASNWDLTLHARASEYRDKIWYTDANGTHFQPESLGISSDTVKGLIEHNVAVYSVVGYYDAASAKSAAVLLSDLRGGSNHSSNHRYRLTMGPWTHGARAGCSPFAPTNAPCFDVVHDVRRYMDHHLQGIRLPEGEKPVQYFVVGEERWRGAHRWPPAGHAWTPLYFGSDHTLTAGPPSDGNRVDVHHVDSTTTSGEDSRWNTEGQYFLKPTRYPMLAAESRKSLVYTSEPLKRALRIVGAPALCIALETNAADAGVFAYLEDVDHATNATHYITEGQVLASHRPLASFDSCNDVVAASAHETWDPVAAFARTFTAAHRRDLSGRTLVPLALEPVAYRVAAGHSIRIALAGADTDNFEFDPQVKVATEWRVHRSSSTLSLVLLPIMEAQAI